MTYLGTLVKKKDLATNYFMQAVESCTEYGSVPKFKDSPPVYKAGVDKPEPCRDGVGSGFLDNLYISTHTGPAWLGLPTWVSCTCTSLHSQKIPNPCSKWPFIQHHCYQWPIVKHCCILWIWSLVEEYCIMFHPSCLLSALNPLC